MKTGERGPGTPAPRICDGTLDQVVEAGHRAAGGLCCRRSHSPPHYFRGKDCFLACGMS